MRGDTPSIPVLAVSAFAYAYQAMDAPKAYTGFLVLGGAMSAFWLNVLWGMGASAAGEFSALLRSQREVASCLRSAGAAPVIPGTDTGRTG